MKNYGIGVVNAFLLAMAVYAGLIFFMFFKYNQDSTSYTDIKDSFINVEIGEYQTQEPDIKPQIQQIKKDDGQETTNKEVKTEEVKKKESDLNELFGDIEQFQNKKDIAVQSSAKSVPDASKPKKEQENNNQKGDNLMPQSKKIGESNKKQQKGVYDKFKGALSRKFNENWNLFERSGNFKVELKFQIESNGIFRYTSVTKSGNAEFDNKVLSFLSTLEGKYVAAPWNKKKYSGTASLSDEIITMGE